jgi:hypothetical protein
MQMQVLRKCGLGARQKETLHSDGKVVLLLRACAGTRRHQQHGGQFEQGAGVRTSAATQRSHRLLFDAGNGGGRRSPSLLLSCLNKVSLRCLYQDVCVT